MTSRLQRYLDTLGRIPTDAEAADMARMSRRGFFGATVGLVMAPHLSRNEACFAGCDLASQSDFTVWRTTQHITINEIRRAFQLPPIEGLRVTSFAEALRLTEPGRGDTILFPST